MTIHDYSRVKAIFGEAEDRSTGTREEFVRSRCGPDEELQDEVLRLVRARRFHMANGGQANGDFEGDLDAVADRVEAAMPGVGERVARRYELLELLGSGGQGRVYRARDHVRRCDVAVKFVTLACPRQRKRYVRELATLRRARVPGVVELLDDGNVGPWAFLVMELVEGGAFPGADVTPGDLDAILPRAVSLLQAVGRLHARGVFHRDLKPANVLVGRDGGVTLVDLGIAEDESDSERGEDGPAVIGTLPYMAPERRIGSRASPRSDLHAAGVMLIEALTGSVPVPMRGCETRGSGPSVVVPRSLYAPDAVLALLGAMTAWREEDRPQNALEVLGILGQQLPAERRIELPWLGDTTAVDGIVEAASRGASIDLVGGPGSGRTRTLLEAERRLQAAGRLVRWVEPAGAQPLHALLARDESLSGATAAERDEALRARIHGLLRDGMIVFADDVDELDPATRTELAELAGSGAVVRALRHPGGGREAVTVCALSRPDLIALVNGPDRLFHLREDVAELLWARTRGRPDRLIREVEAWCSAGLARWDGKVVVRPESLPRLRSAALALARPAAVREVAGLHAIVRRVWDALTLAGAPLSAASLGRVIDESPRVVRGSFADLVARGVAHTEGPTGELEKTSVLDGSPYLASLDEGLRAQWSDRISLELPERSERRFRHLVVAERYAEACRTAAEIARAKLVSGDIAGARVVLDVALTVARRHLPDNVRLYALLLARMADVAISRATVEAVDLALYHAELAPRRTESVDAWAALLHAAALCLHSSPQRAVEELDGYGVFPSDEHERLRHVIANVAAKRSPGPSDLRDRVARAVAWARRRQNRDARSLAAAWTGWLRFREGRYAAAAGLHTRSARLTPRRRAKTHALCNAATAHLEAGQIVQATACAIEAAKLAKSSRDVVSLARAERLERAAAYRSGEARRIDEPLLTAAEQLDSSTMRGALFLGEAAIAWRARRLDQGAELAGGALRDFSEHRQLGPAALAAGLQAACGRAGSDDAKRRTTWTGPIGIVAQTAALWAAAGAGPDVPREVRERALAWAAAADQPDLRREILSPTEVRKRLESREPTTGAHT